MSINSASRSFSWLAACLLLLLSSCGSSGDGSTNRILTAVQDLTVGPDGLSTLITFKSSAGSLQASDFESDGGQTPTAVSLSGKTATVTWDERVTPSDRVRVIGKSGIKNGYVAVTTSDPSAPTFVVTSALQFLGLGNDTISVQFSGPRVVEALAEDIANWNLVVGGTSMDLVGSTFTLDNNTQVLTIFTGPGANLHASFQLAALGVTSVANVPLSANPVNGSASGDSTPPMLLYSTQNLSVDPYGRVYDFGFNEAMDPVFAVALTGFVGVGPDLATSVTQTLPTELQVSFNNPLLPGIDSVTLTGLMDAHGNVMPDATPALSAGSTVANGFSVDPVVETVANIGGDFVDLLFIQALDPDSAVVAANWDLQSTTGNTIDLSAATFTYDLIAKTLHIELVQDLQTGLDFLFQPGLTSAFDVDGQPFLSTFSGFVGGDTIPPFVVRTTQNRNVDPSGLTLDVSLSEDVEITSAQTLANWAIPGFTINSATLLAGLDTVRLLMQTAPIPGDDTLTSMNVVDLAGKTMVTAAGQAIISSDTTPPRPLSGTALAIEGSANDIVAVTFDDEMIAAEVANIANWSLETPIGVSFDLSGATVNWSKVPRTARLSLPNGSNLKLGDAFVLEFFNMRDIGGNVVTNDTIVGTVDGEINVPHVDSVWVETNFGNEVHVRFSEPCDRMDDLMGFTSYTVRDSGGSFKGTPSSATIDADDMGVELVFGFSVLAGSDTMDAQGITDLAGNAVFPAFSVPVEAENSSPVDLSIGSSVFSTVTGEENDQIQLVFDQRPSLWQLLKPSKYVIQQGGVPLGLTAESLSYDGATTVTIDLDSLGAVGLLTGQTYDITIASITSAQGVTNVSALTDSIVCAGDSMAPALGAGGSRVDPFDPNSVIIELSEALLPGDTTQVGNYKLNGGPNPVSASQLGPRSVRASFAAAILPTDQVSADLRDVAGILGSVSQIVGPADSSGPLVTAVQGLSVANLGGDTIEVVFDEPVEAATALDANNYSVTNGAATVDVAGAILRYTSATNTVEIRLPAGVELDPTAGVTVDVTGVKDVAGLVMNPPASLGGAVSGDNTPPDFDAAFVNFAASSLGTAIDVLFDEDVDAVFAADPLNWGITGVATITTVQSLDGSHWRLTLSQPHVPGETISMSGLPDVAGNSSGPISIQPTN